MEVNEYPKPETGRGSIWKYKHEIIRTLESIDECRFLRQVYIIIVHHLRGIGLKEELLLVKIKISYERPEELRRIVEKLGQDMKRIKSPRIQEGKFRKAYIEIKE